MKTLGELKTQIADWLNRTDLTGQIPEFIRMAEDTIYQRLRTRDNEFVYTIEPLIDPDNPANNIDPITPIELPQNYKQIKLVAINDRQLRHVSDQEFYAYRRGPVIGVDPVFTVIARQLHLYPWPEETPETWENITRIDIHYWGSESLLDLATWDTEIVANSAPPVAGTAEWYDQIESNTTRMFQLAPQMFLHGALYYAYIYLQQPDEAQFQKALFDAAIAQVIAEDRESHFTGSTTSVGSVYSGGDYARRYR